jgi:hypothetical protein
MVTHATEPRAQCAQLVGFASAPSTLRAHHSFEREGVVCLNQQLLVHYYIRGKEFILPRPSSTGCHIFNMKSVGLLVVSAAYVYMRVAVHPTITSQKNSRHEKIKCNLHISKSPYFLQNNKDNSGRGEVVLHGSMKTCSGCHTFTAELCSR